MHIRSATEADAPVLLPIYAPNVLASAVSFELEVPTVEEFAGRIAKALSKWDWLVAEMDGRCVGYAYASLHRDRPGYRLTAEVSAYVAEGYQRKGIAKRLYTELLERLATKGYCTAVAGITLPNEASVALHKALGFEEVGTFCRVGWKFGAWQDTCWMQKRLRDEPLE